MIDQKANSLVHGYIRRNQTILTSNHPLLMISDLVIYKCLIFYHEVMDYFVDNNKDIFPSNHPDCFYELLPALTSVELSKLSESMRAERGINKCRILSINKENDTMYHVHQAQSPGDYDAITCYGHVNIPSISRGIHQWTFQIITTTDCRVSIGIDEYQRRWNNETFHKQKDTINYSCDGVHVWCSGECDMENIRQKRCFSPYKSGAITMTLDLESCCLKWNTNNDEDGAITYHNIKTDRNITYCMAVSCRGYGRNQVQLLSYYHKQFI